MKLQKLLSIALAVVMALSLVACSNDGSSSQQNSSTVQNSAQQDSLVESSLWDNATYTEDTEIGEGEKSVALTVTMEEKSIVVTIKTDADNLGDALRETGFATGEESEYGLYVKVVNGVSADYETDGAYWALLQNGEATTFGVDGAVIEEGSRYEMAYTPAR